MCFQLSLAWHGHHLAAAREALCREANILLELQLLPVSACNDPAAKCTWNAIVELKLSSYLQLCIVPEHH